METNYLQYFRVLVETGHVRNTAELLGVSHGGLIKMIRKLEQDLGVQITTKDGRNIRITSEGMNVYRRSLPILSALEEMKNGATNTYSEKLTDIRIGTFEVFSTYFAPHIVKALPKKVNITFTESLPGEIEEKVIKEEIHFGITYLPVPKPDLEHLLIKKIEMGVFGNLSAGFQHLPFEEWPFVIPLTKIETTPSRANGLDGWPDPLFRRSIRYQVSLMETAIALVRESYAVAYLPKFIIRLHNEKVLKEMRLTELTCPKKVTQSQAVYLVKRRSEEESDTMKKVARALRAL